MAMRGRRPGVGREQREGAEPSGTTATGRGGGRGVIAGARRFARAVGGTTAASARQFASTARDAASGLASRTQETVSGAVDKVRDNPWPSLLIGAGVTWLAVDAVRGRGPTGRRRRKARDQGPGLVRRTASTIADASRGAGEYVGDFVRERPLLAGAATLGVGMAVGMAMPSTSAENRFMGNARDSVMRSARTAAKGTMSAVREVAEGVERLAAGGGRDRERMR
jgi:ElaB/YqjD/DUF883 family membrane-anchored ribosome-binding protein